MVYFSLHIAIQCIVPDIFVVGQDVLTASGKASAAGANEGFVKLIFNAADNTLLGAHLVGANVTEMIAELVLARKEKITGHELITAIHPHPTCFC